MAITPVIRFKPTDWQIDYRAALLEYPVRLKLKRAITSCMKAMRELALDDCTLIERRAVATALHDLLVLRYVNCKYETVRMEANAEG